MNIPADAVVLTAPDGCAKYLQRAVKTSLAEMDEDAVLEVPCDPFSMIDIAEWCVSNGHRIVNPFDHWHVDHLLVENTRRQAIAA